MLPQGHRRTAQQNSQHSGGNTEMAEESDGIPGIVLAEPYRALALKTVSSQEFRYALFGLFQDLLYGSFSD